MFKKNISNLIVGDDEADHDIIPGYWSNSDSNKKNAGTDRVRLKTLCYYEERAVAY
jgi:hypothetical protein